MKSLKRLLESLPGKILAIILISIALLRFSTPCWGDFELSQYEFFKNIEVQTAVVY